MRRFDLDTCEEIILTITRNKTRSLLTAFGIFWGIFMLVALMGGTKGVQDLMAKQFVGFATNSGFMGTNQTSKAYKGFQQGRFWELTNTDVERVRRSVPEIEVVTPNITKWGIEMVYNENKTSGTLKGLYPIYAKIEEPQISMGRYINDMDILNRRKVCVLGSRIFESLFPDKSNPCGKYIEVNPEFAKDTVCAYAKINGISVAVLAGNGEENNGYMSESGVKKAANFIKKANAFGLPLISLVDCKGFDPSLEEELAGFAQKTACENLICPIFTACKKQR